MKTLKLSCLFSLLTVALSVLAQTKDAAAPHVDLISIDGTINPAVDDFIRESIGRAKASGAKALIIQLDTPGGLLNSTPVSYTHLRAHETPEHLVCRLLLEKK